ncbi:TPA_exp: hypothetical protein A8136_2176 [Trichophyton benhamiae CBS 112371]|nr:TPA_exp: hypothetical protein A8136_2176 [Trichophyton benhamiae CBS 112371]
MTGSVGSFITDSKVGSFLDTRNCLPGRGLDTRAAEVVASATALMALTAVLVAFSDIATAVVSAWTVTIGALIGVYVAVEIPAVGLARFSIRASERGGHRGKADDENGSETHDG